MCDKLLEERVNNEFELFYLSLQCTSIDQVFSRAREIYLKGLIKKTLLSMDLTHLQEEERLLACSENILDYLYVHLYDQQSPSGDEEWIEGNIEKLLKAQKKRARPKRAVQ